jgi:hypothetical protein
VRGEAVWKVVLGWCFATLARMRKRYPTDLSDAEWNYIPSLTCPPPKDSDAPGPTAFARSLNAVFFYVLKRAVGSSGGSCPTTFPGGPPSTATSENGVSTVPGSASIGPSENACEEYA